MDSSLLTTDYKQKFAEIFVRIAKDSKDVPDLRSRGAGLYLEHLKAIRDIVEDLGPNAVPHLVVHSGNKIKLAVHNPHDNPAVMLDGEIHVAIEGTEISKHIGDILYAYSAHHLNDSAGKHLSGLDFVPVSHHSTGNNGRSSHSKAVKEAGIDTHSNQAMFDPVSNDEEPKRFGNTRGDVFLYKNITDEERAFWIKSIFERREQYKPGDFLRALRVVNGITTQEMADKLGVTQSEYSTHIENNRHPITLKHSLKILDDNIFRLPVEAVTLRSGESAEVVQHVYSKPFLDKLGHHEALYPPQMQDQALSVIHALTDAVAQGDLAHEDLPNVSHVTRYLLRGKLSHDISEDADRRKEIAVALNPKLQLKLYDQVDAIGSGLGMSEAQSGWVKKLPYKTKNGAVKASPAFTPDAEIALKVARENADTVGDYLRLYRETMLQTPTDIEHTHDVAKATIKKWETKTKLEPEPLQRIVENNYYAFPVQEDGSIRQDVLDDLAALNRREKLGAKPGRGR